MVVNAPGVVIRRSKVTCPSNIAVGSFNGRYSGKWLLLDQVDINCGNTPGTGVGDMRVYVSRSNIHGCENGFDVDGKFVVEDSYIHDLSERAENHSDGIQTNINANDITVRHNAFYVHGGTSAMITHPNGNKGVLIINNFMAGGAYTLYCPRDDSTNYRVKNNHFSTVLYAKGGAYGPWTYCEKLRTTAMPGGVVSGNIWHETGQAVAF